MPTLEVRLINWLTKLLENQNHLVSGLFMCLDLGIDQDCWSKGPYVISPCHLPSHMATSGQMNPFLLGGSDSQFHCSRKKGRALLDFCVLALEAIQNHFNLVLLNQLRTFPDLGMIQTLPLNGRSFKYSLQTCLKISP